MNNNLNLIQRLLAETPKDARILRMLALLIFGLLPRLSQFIPANIIAHLSDYAIAAAALASFAVKEAAVINSAPSLPDGLFDVLQDLPTQIADLKTAIKTQPDLSNVTFAAQAIPTLKPEPATCIPTPAPLATQIIQNAQGNGTV